MRCTPTARPPGSRPLVLAARAGVVGAWLALLSGASCPTKTDDCRHGHEQRCLWERGEANQDGEGPTTGSGGAPLDTDPTVASREEATALDLALADMIEIMGGGLEWALIDERARALCVVFASDGESDEMTPSEPTPDPETPDAWSCPIFALDINGQPLELEASVGVIALSAEPLDASQSAALLEFARARFDDRCGGGFEELEGAKLEVYHRCALPEGPYLVIARFPRDLEADQWQVSIAVVDAG